jgi:hypothetical protein
MFIPATLRILLLAACLAGLVYGAMYYLAYEVQPEPGEVILEIPPERLTGGAD